MIEVAPETLLAAYNALAERHGHEVAAHELTKAQLAATMSEIAVLSESFSRLEEEVRKKE